MKCPNCNKDVGEADPECLNCGFILSKWRAAQAAGEAAGLAAGTGTATPALAPRSPSDGSVTISGETLLLFGLFLSVSLYYFVFMRGSADAQGRQEVAGGQCVLSGEVVDIYRLQPAGGIKIVFGPKAETMTDGFGRYMVKVKVGVDYAAEMTSAQYRPNYIESFTRDWHEATFDQRVRAARSVATALNPDGTAMRKAEVRCEAGEERIFNFAVLPVSVTSEEQSLIDAVP